MRRKSGCAAMSDPWSVLCADMTYLSAMRPEELLTPTPSGVCCQTGGFHIDPTRPVDKARDHARPFRPCAAGPRRGAGDAGDARPDAAALRREFRRLDAGGQATARRMTLGGATVTFHPAGHVLGSAQVAVECNGLRIVASGDYKDVADPTCAPFELVPCDVFITEATFGLPVFRHGDRGGRDRQAPAFGRAVSRARASGRRLFARQGAARDRADPRRPATTSRSICTARWRSITHYYEQPRHRPRRARAGARRRARPSLPAPSRSARRRRCRTCGRGASPIRCRASPPAGCGCGRARASAASNCRW